MLLFGIVVQRIIFVVDQVSVHIGAVAFRGVEHLNGHGKPEFGKPYLFIPVAVLFHHLKNGVVRLFPRIGVGLLCQRYPVDRIVRMPCHAVEIDVGIAALFLPRGELAALDPLVQCFPEAAEEGDDDDPGRSSGR